MYVYIKKDYTAKYPDAIEFDAGAAVRVEREDPEFPGWYWCRVPSGKEGWVHRSFLAATAGDTVGLHDFSGREITVVAGERAVVVFILDGWAWVKPVRGGDGWIPKSHAF
jgi:SH3-like domain-containing protein